jgi:hypothetical protein
LTPIKKEGQDKATEEEKKKPEYDRKTLGRGLLSLEVAEVKGVKVFICVFRNTIGKNLFEGQLTAKLSRKFRIKEKAHKFQLKL